MVEAHGWITLRYSDYHSADAEQNAFIYKFKQFMQQHYDWVLHDQIGRITSRNGLNCFTLTVLHNHPHNPFYPLDIFAWAAKNSTGSYGMLYYHDDEDKVYHNEFQVVILKRGRLTKAVDSFLSPYIEEVERDYDENNPPQD